MIQYKCQGDVFVRDRGGLAGKHEYNYLFNNFIGGDLFDMIRVVLHSYRTVPPSS